MSAFRRRTHFATPLIITLAACSSGKPRDEPPPKRYPGTKWYVSKAGEHCRAGETDLGCPEGVRCNPPPPTESKCPPFPEGQDWAHVVKRPDGTCAVLPPGCEDDSCVGAKTDCPLPLGQTLAEEPKPDEPKPDETPAP